MLPFLPPPIGRPWLGQRIAPDAVALHTAHVRETWRTARPHQKLALSVATLFWPLILLVLAARQTLASGRVAVRESGKSYMAQFLEQLSNGLTGLMLPKHYYLFELFRAGSRSTRFNYLLNTPKESWAPASRAAQPVSFPPEDRRQFAETCAAMGLPAVPCLAAFRSGMMVFPRDAAPEFPLADLFLKPAKGSAGRGVERWLYLCGKWHDGLRGLSAIELQDHCKSLSRDRDYIVQEMVRSHSAFLGLIMGGWVVLRAITMLNRDGIPESHFAVLRMPSRNGATSNDFQTGGIAAAVDLHSGIAGKATNIGLVRRSGWYSTHPSSGAQIEGLAIPRFRDALTLAERAHARFQGAPLVGWDIAITEAGVALVEADACPDLEIIQRTHRMPLGGTPFGQLLAWHMQRLDPAGHGQATVRRGTVGYSGE